MLNPMAYNPGYAGLDESLSFTGVYRKQWVGLEGSPTSQNLNVHFPLYFLRSGFGLVLGNDAVGAERNTNLQIAYNFRLPVGETGILTAGVSGGGFQKELDGSRLVARDGLYGPDFQVITHNDDFIPLGVQREVVPTLGAGVYFKNERLEVGLSTQHINAPQAAILADNSQEVEINQIYFFNFAAHFDLWNAFSLHPSVFVKSDVVQTQAEISAIIRHDSNIFGGASFRGYDANSLDAIILLAGFKLSENISISYSYDIGISELNTVHSGSHEILLNYNLNRKLGGGIPPEVIYNPRFL